LHEILERVAALKIDHPAQVKEIALTIQSDLLMIVRTLLAILLRPPTNRHRAQT
jgi:hypothetical protein